MVVVHAWPLSSFISLKNVVFTISTKVRKAIHSTFPQSGGYVRLVPDDHVERLQEYGYLTKSRNVKRRGSAPPTNKKFPRLADPRWRITKDQRGFLKVPPDRFGYIYVCEEHDIFYFRCTLHTSRC